MSTFKLRPTHAPVKAYYETLARLEDGKFDNEGQVRRAFQALLEKAKPSDWQLVEEYQIKRSGKSPLRADGALLDAFHIDRGLWEAKDEKDDLDAEIKKKFTAGYPQTNILFQQPTRIVLYQGGRKEFDEDIHDPEKLVEALKLFFDFVEPPIRNWEHAVTEFSTRIPDIAAGAMQLMEREKKTNKAFIESFAAFADVCRESINPDLKDEAIEEMLVQHLLTERIFRQVFANSQFTRRNVIAIEIEKVIDSLTSRHFSRDEFLKPLDRYYKAIEEAAASRSEYSEKQSFLNKVYEQFFKAVNPKQADTHGIVYTPQPIVDFMVRSVEEILKTEFGRSMSDRDVHILDPFVGTGNFITRIMQEIPKTKLQHKYREELHCNEVMLLPYYIASMNIEHAYLEATREYEPFEGICLVDTFELAEPRQGTLFTTENTERVRKQKRATITVIVGNPPYNVGQDEENDNNKNRKYKHLDREIADTYAKDSNAQNKNGLRDHYVRALRWASSRIGSEGAVAFVVNSKFIRGKAADGIRLHLRRNFSDIFVIDLGGDVRSNSKLSGTKNNVFGIQLGVCIIVLVKHSKHTTRKPIHYVTAGEYWTRQEKLDWLRQMGSSTSASWSNLVPNERNEWITSTEDEEFSNLVPIWSNREATAIFERVSNGVKSNRDYWVFNFDATALAENIRNTIDFYNDHVVRWRTTQGIALDQFMTYDDHRISWSRDLKKDVERGVILTFCPHSVRRALYRPFQRVSLYFDKHLNEEVYQMASVFPPKVENDAIVVTAHQQIPFSTQAVDCLPCVDLGGRPSQVFPMFLYDEDGANRRENITDWALTEFRSHYGDSSISKLDIFHYTYALLHHPEYRTRYAANLKRELPRIPMAPEFRHYAEIGARLMDIHIHYEQQPEYPLMRTETGPLDWRVEKMKLSKDKSQLAYNGFLTFSGIPPEVYEYRLGNRSALDWVVDQYQVSTDKRSGIVNDPNREDDPEYIVRLIGQVVSVSLETVNLVKELAQLSIDQAGIE